MSTSVKCSIQAAAKEAAKRLGYDKLKGLQLEVVEGLCGGRDVFAVLPTGYGKSLCYESLPWTYDSLCDCPMTSIVVVVTPLTAIIEEQVLLLTELSYAIINLIFRCSDFHLRVYLQASLQGSLPSP